MNQRILPVALFVIALAAVPVANAGVEITVNPFGWIAPPVVYAPSPIYAPPPVVYGGGGSWGGHRERHERGRRGRR
jgi:hypothetical protein